MDEDGQDNVGRWRWVGWGALGVALSVALVWGAVSLFGHAGPQKRVVKQTVTMLDAPKLPPPPPPPPPPPTPPKVEEKPTEAPKQAEAAKVPDKAPPKAPAPPKAAPAPPGNPLSGEAGAPNGYGIGVGGPGGDTIGGGGGGGGGNGWGAYGQKLAHDLQTVLDRDPRTRFGKFRTNGRVTISPTGQIVAAELASSGDPAIDAAIQDIIRGQKFDPPPAGMPPKITIKINARPV